MALIQSRVFPDGVYVKDLLSVLYQLRLVPLHAPIRSNYGHCSASLGRPPSYSISRSFRFCITLLICFFLITEKASAQSNASGQSFSPGELIIGYHSRDQRDAAAREFRSTHKTFNLASNQIARASKVFDMGSKAIRLQLDLPSALQAQASRNPELEKEILLETARRIMASDKRIKYAHPNWILSLPAPKSISPGIQLKRKHLNSKQERSEHQSANDPAFRRELHWNYSPPPMGMNAEAAWSISKGSREVFVAVIDTGINSKHKDIATSGNVVGGYSFVGRRGEQRNPKFEDAHAGSHGTHVAALIGAAGTNNRVGIAAINWKVSIVVIRAIAADGSASTMDIADAIRWAAGLLVEGVPRNPHPAHVINLSLGGRIHCSQEKNGYQLDAITDAIKAGSIIVAAAGNSGDDVAKYSPAGCQGTITVAAHNRRGHLTPYSNHGDIDVLAPGGMIIDDDYSGGVWSSVRQSSKAPQGIAAYQGTSMAAPHVTAAIAMLLSAKPELRRQPARVKRLLKLALRPIAHDACARPCGSGQLDAARLLIRASAENTNIVSSPETQPKLGTDIVASSPKPIELAQAKVTTKSISGRWMLPSLLGDIIINEREWVHPSYGIARTSFNKPSGVLTVVYPQATGVRCKYTYSLLNDGTQLRLIALDNTQPSDLCPNGLLTRRPQ